MGYLIVGLVLLMVVYYMLRIAAARPDNSPVRFLSREGPATVCAIVLTAFFGFGLIATVAGSVKLVAVAAAYVD